MKTFALLAVVVIILMQTSCVFVRPKAATVLKFRPDRGKSEYVSVGFRDAKWSSVDGKVTLVGYGWHYREHETYAFFHSEPSSHNPRWLLIEGDGRSSDFSLRVRWPFGSDPFRPTFSGEMAEYRAHIPAVATTSGNTLTLALRDVPLQSVDGKTRVFLSGQIKAKPDTEQVVRQMAESAENAERKIAEPDGAANGSQPIRSETNRTSSAAGSRR